MDVTMTTIICSFRVFPIYCFTTGACAWNALPRKASLARNDCLLLWTITGCLEKNKQTPQLLVVLYLPFPYSDTTG